MRSTKHPRRPAIGAAVLAISALVNGCAHPFEVISPSSNHGPPPTLSYATDISLMGPQDYLRGPYMGCIADALSAVGGVSILPADRAEVLVRVEPEPRYSGSAQNFFITFPGFLVNLPWWIGYSYTIDVSTNIVVSHYGRSRQRLVHHSFDVRHACSSRVTVAAMGWVSLIFEPLFVVPLVGGFFHLYADEEDVLAEIRYGLRDAYGVEIARQVVELLEELTQPRLREPPLSPNGLADG